MPYCNKCGLQVNEEMQFCPNCGAQLKFPRELLDKPVLSAKKSTTSVLSSWNSFANGLSIGLGAAIILGTLAIVYFLNRSFWTLQENLTAEGLSSPQIAYLVTDIRILLSGAVVFSFLGIYLVILGTASQLSPTARAILNSKNMRVRLGNGCFVGALVFASSSVSNLVRNIYSPYSFGGWFPLAFGIGSVVLILIGLLLVLTARTK
jgi:hypothetical protein